MKHSATVEALMNYYRSAVPPPTVHRLASLNPLFVPSQRPASWWGRWRSRIPTARLLFSGFAIASMMVAQLFSWWTTGSTGWPVLGVWAIGWLSLTLLIFACRFTTHRLTFLTGGDTEE